MSTVIVTGPQGSGKNLLAPALLKRFGCTGLVEDWWPGTPLTEGALHLTHHPIPEPRFRDARVYQIEEVR